MTKLDDVVARKVSREAAEARREQLRADVAVMRELGVAKWDEIILGPPPQPRIDHKDLTPEEQQERIAARQRAEHDTLFAASGTRPRMPGELPTRPLTIQNIVGRRK